MASTADFAVQSFSPASASVMPDFAGWVQSTTSNPRASGVLPLDRMQLIPAALSRSNSAGLVQESGQRNGIQVAGVDIGSRLVRTMLS